MAAFKNRVGDRYGRLLVLSHSGKDHRSKHLWLCRCDCGNEKVIVSDNLSSGKSNSCGCLKQEALQSSRRRLDDREDAILRVQYSHIKRRSRKFDGVVMGYEVFVEKSKCPCIYCGLEWSKEIEDRRNEMKSAELVSDTVVRISGIDRIDSYIGYTEHNSVPCCKFCNFAKNTMSLEEFMEWVSRVYNFNQQGDNFLLTQPNSDSTVLKAARQV